MTAFPFLTIASAVAVISIINYHTHLVVAAVAVVESRIDQEQTTVFDKQHCVNDDDNDCITGDGAAAADDEKSKENYSIFERIDDWMKGTTTNNSDGDKATGNNDDTTTTSGIDYYLKKLFEGHRKSQSSQTQPPPSTDDTTTTTTSSDSTDTKKQEQEEKQKPNDPFAFLSQIFPSWSTTTSSSSTTTRRTRDALNLIQHARNFTNTQQERRTFEQNFKLFSTSLTLVLSSLKDHFGQLLHELPNVSPLSLFYFMEDDEERRNPTWKRRVHRFEKSFPPEDVPSLHEKMLLAELAYLDTVEEMRERLTKITGGQWELIYGTVESAPHEPSHFLALKTGHYDDDDDDCDDDELPLLLSVRGTKEVGDALSDALLDAMDYRNEGKTHRGIALAGRYLVEKHAPLFRHLLASSGRSRIRLVLVGHSLGAGAATIAAMEFNELVDPPVRATVWGYGCPSLLSPDLAKEVEGYVTTVVADADVVPRLSGASVVNWLLDVASYDWTERAYRDVESFIKSTEGSNGQMVAEWILPKENIFRFINETLRDRLEKETKSVMERRRRRTMERQEKSPPPVLIPPGRCVHFYRDGKSVSATYMPCDFFNRIDMSLTMIEDHLTPTGYHRLFLEMMREHYQDHGYNFLHESVFVAT